MDPGCNEGLDVAGRSPLACPGRVNPVTATPREVTAMIWEAPDFVEIKMDAEINSYQDDFEREQDDRF
jgi:hypothetical protein